MSHSYRVPAAPAEVVEVIRRSRFVTRAGHAASREDAARFIEEVRQALPGATHYCWAFNAGAPGSTTHIGMSDAGEPHGTAGRPMLTTLLHSGVGEVVAVCARFYGGVKLGTGGLARAYSGGVKRVLDVCSTVEKVERTPVLVTVSYEASPRVDRFLAELDATVTEKVFGADVRYHVLVPAHHRARLDVGIADATRGRGRVEP